MSSELTTYTVEELISEGVLAPPLDGNHGGIHPKTSDFVASGIPFIMASDMKDGIVDTKNCSFISAEQASKLRKGFSKTGDVLLSHKATIGRTALVGKIDSEYIVLTPQVTYYRVLDSKRLNNRYLKYYFDSLPFQQTLASWAGAGSTRAYIGITAQRKLPITLPAIKIQEAIAEMIGALDDRILLLRETNSTLEAIAQALFKSWFVDFDPVRAKQEGREPEGMDAEAAALFPDSFEESELGLVPKGWRVKSLDTIAEYLNGLALQKFPPDEDEWLPVIKIAQLRKGDTNGADRASRRLKSEYIIQNGDVLFSWSGSLDVVVWCGGEGALNQHLFKVTSKNYPKWFYYFWTKHHLASFQQTAASKATTMGHIQRKHLTEAKVIVPPIESIQAINGYFTPLLDRWITNELKARTLTTLRDTLLPRLISGQLRLPDAEALIEEAAA
mgnify:CR=1 FL=1